MHWQQGRRFFYYAKRFQTEIGVRTENPASLQLGGNGGAYARLRCRKEKNLYCLQTAWWCSQARNRDPEIRLAASQTGLAHWTGTSPQKTDGER